MTILWSVSVPSSLAGTFPSTKIRETQCLSGTIAICHQPGALEHALCLSQHASFVQFCTYPFWGCKMFYLVCCTICNVSFWDLPFLTTRVSLWTFFIQTVLVNPKKDLLDSTLFVLLDRLFCWKGGSSRFFAIQHPCSCAWDNMQMWHS